MTVTNDLSELEISTNRRGSDVLVFEMPSMRIGTADYALAGTGCTVFDFKKRAMMVTDCRGGAIGALGTHYPVVDSICFAGGSAYGLEAIMGVGAELHRRVDYSTDWQDIGLAAGAIIFDYRFRENAVYPDKALGRAAHKNAIEGQFSQGRFGAGSSASAGKALVGAGLEGELTGQGAAFTKVGNVEIFVATILNPFGAIVDRSGEVVRGNFDPRTNQRSHVHEHLSARNSPEMGNTTLTLMVTNLKLPRAALQQVAKQVHSSMARGIQPFHTEFDGDVLFAVSTEEVEENTAQPFALGTYASELAWDAILKAASSKDD